MYIYQHKDWPHFTWDLNLISLKLGEVRHRQGRILGQMSALGFRLKEETFLETLTLDVIKSSEIEGELLNPDQVRSSIAKRLGIEFAGTAIPERKVDGVVDMMLDATQNHEQALTQDRLFKWHNSLFPSGISGLHKVKVAEWRDGPMEVVSGAMGRERVHFEAPSAERVPAEMFAFINWMNTEQPLDPVIKAGIAHLWFVTIHPFDDGNGRIARAIADMQLARADKSKQRFYSMSARIQKERKAYYDILEETHKGSPDITLWLEWFLDCLYRSMEYTEHAIDKAIQRNRFWEDNRTTEFNIRQQKILNALLDEFFGKLNVSKWAKMTGTSTDTALRDIQDLVRKDILVQEGAGRSTGYKLK